MSAHNICFHGEIRKDVIWIPHLLGHWPAMVYLPPPSPRGNFVDHVFLKTYYLESILQHVSHLAIEALPSISLLHSLPLQNV